MKNITVGILAHVDAGKTSLSEAMLYTAGEIRKQGRVDHGNAFLDTFALEKERGITIFSKQAVFDLPGTHVSLLDTPGHADFVPEAERVLPVLDYAILVISGSEGVQSHTRTLWQLLERYGVPVFLFINKMDLAGADRGRVLKALKESLSEACVDMEQQDPDERNDALSMCTERLMEEILEEGTPSTEAITEAIANRKLFPCWFGAALKNEGMDTFLRGIDAYTEMPGKERAEAFGARVFKITRDQDLRLTWIKVTSGVLKAKGMLSGMDREGTVWTEKADRILIYSGAKNHPAESVSAGEVCAVAGLTKAVPGMGLGREAEPVSIRPLMEPVLAYGVTLPQGTDVHKALACFRTLEEEEPQLHVLWDERYRIIRVQLMGAVQLEILQSLLRERFGLSVAFMQGKVLYKETILNAVEGVGHYEPLRHYAEVHLLLEPLPLGSGLLFETDCSTDVLDKNWQRLVLTHLYEKVHRGVLTGSPITDMRITLKSGKAHIKHTEGGDFRQATYRAVRQGLRQARSRLLEPWYTFMLEIPSMLVGRAISDLTRMCAEFEPPETRGDMAVLTGTAPVATIANYHEDVIAYTRGEGRIFCVSCGYRPCHNEEEVIRAFCYDCDGDLENTADSVFCSHGAGQLIRWDKVPEYMHLESCFTVRNRGNAAETQKKQEEPGSGYRMQLAEDKELMRIFERTYGPVKQTGVLAFRPPVKEEHAEKRDIPVQTEETEYLLVDGYNIIFAWDEIKRIAERDLDLARNRLTEVLINYRGFHACDLILVFDAYRVRGNPGSVEKQGGISIVYTQEAETADSYIEKAAYRLAKEKKVRVATSDGQEQLIILGEGAIRVSAREFHEEVLRTEERIRELMRRDMADVSIGEGPLSRALASMREDLEKQESSI